MSDSEEIQSKNEFYSSFSSGIELSNVTNSDVSDTDEILDVKDFGLPDHEIEFYKKYKEQQMLEDEKRREKEKERDMERRKLVISEEYDMNLSKRLRKSDGAPARLKKKDYTYSGLSAELTINEIEALRSIGNRKRGRPKRGEEPLIPLKDLQKSKAIGWRETRGRKPKAILSQLHPETGQLLQKIIDINLKVDPLLEIRLSYAIDRKK